MFPPYGLSFKNLVSQCQWHTVENLRHLEVKYHRILTNFEQEGDSIRTKLGISSFATPGGELLGPPGKCLLIPRGSFRCRSEACLGTGWCGESAKASHWLKLEIAAEKSTAPKSSQVERICHHDTRTQGNLACSPCPVISERCDTSQAPWCPCNEDQVTLAPCVNAQCHCCKFLEDLDKGSDFWESQITA